MMLAGSDIEGRFRRGIIWNTANAIVTQFLNFLTTILVANLLGRESFGAFGIIQSTLLTTASLAQIATGITATKYVAEYRASDKERVGRILGMCSLVTSITGVAAMIGIIAAAPLLATRSMNAPGLSLGLRLSAGFLFFSVINGYQIGALGGLEAYRMLTVASATQGICQIAICGVSTWLWGINGAFTGLVITSCVRWLSYYLALRIEAKEQGIEIIYSRLRSESDVLIKFAIPAALSGFSSPPAIWLGNALLVRQFRGFSQMAVFSAALNLKNFVMFLPIVLNRVGTAILNNQRGAGNQRHYRSVFWINTGISGISALLGAAFMAAFGTHLLRLYGASYSDGYSVLIILLCAACFEAFAIANYQVVQAQERMWSSFFAIVVPKDVSLVIAAQFLVPSFGATGLAYAHLSCALINFVTVLAITKGLGLNVHAAQRKERPQSASI